MVTLLKLESQLAALLIRYAHECEAPNAAEPLAEASQLHSANIGRLERACRLLGIRALQLRLLFLGGGPAKLAPLSPAPLEALLQLATLRGIEEHARLTLYDEAISRLQEETDPSEDRMRAASLIGQCSGNLQRIRSLYESAFDRHLAYVHQPTDTISPLESRLA